MNVIVDLEHTITNAWHRLDKRTELRLKGTFNKEFRNDRPNENIIMFIRQLMDNDNFVIILSAKKEEYKFDVSNWLSLHKVPYSQLIMKPNGMSDTITPDEFKEQCLSIIGMKIDFALDDVGRNCAMFAKNNIPCLRIEQR